MIGFSFIRHYFLININGFIGYISLSCYPFMNFTGQEVVERYYPLCSVGTQHIEDEVKMI